VVIPPHFAQSAVEAQNKINKACDEAGWLRSFTGAMWVFFFVRWIPLVGIVGWFGMVMTFFSGPVWLIYWWIRFCTHQDCGCRLCCRQAQLGGNHLVVSLAFNVAVFFYLIVLPLALVSCRR
jgi:hypothetical protein